MSVRNLLGLAALALTFAAGACDDDANAPRIIDELEIASGDDQDGVVGTALASPFVVEVGDQDGDPLAGVEVVWSVQSGEGTLSQDTTDTGANGRAQTTFTPTEAGAAEVEAEVEGLPAVTFSVTVDEE